jgi:hypothetical protein
MRQRFADEDVQNVPEVSGIFKLYHEADLVYIGRTPPSSGLSSRCLSGLRSYSHLSRTMTAATGNT